MKLIALLPLYTALIGVTFAYSAQELQFGTEPRLVIEQSTTIDNIVELTFYPFSATTPIRIHLIPAMFGAQFIPLTTLPLFVNTNTDTCHAYTPSLPKLTESQLSLLSQVYPNNTRDYTLASEWFTALPRGACPFDQRILHTQQSGFSGAIIYNDAVTAASIDANGVSLDKFIRMSSNSLGDQIYIPSMFAPYFEIGSMLKSDNVYIVTVQTVPWNFFAHGALTMKNTSFLSQLLFYTSLLMLAISLGMTTAILFGMLKNLYYFGSVSYTGVKRLPKLKTYQLKFPVITYTPAMVCEEACCAICIDDFCAGDCARELPCGHRFHTTWYVFLLIKVTSSVDPWLLGHNRLCPICKLDVTDKSPSSEYAKRQAEGYLEEDVCGELDGERQGMLLYASHNQHL